MPGKLEFDTHKLRSHSVPQLDVTTTKCVSSYKPVEMVEESDMSDTEHKNMWFKTWPERSYEKLEQFNDSSPEKNGSPSSNKCGTAKSHISLNKLLDNIPLAYSPITKQLHVLSPTEQRKEPAIDESKSEMFSDNDDDYHHFQNKTPDSNAEGRFI